MVIEVIFIGVVFAVHKFIPQPKWINEASSVLFRNMMSYNDQYLY